MRIQINSRGNLRLERAGSLLKQYCPFVQAEDGQKDDECGCWCPLFSEPEEGVDGVVCLEICHGKKLKCVRDEFEDRRGEDA